MTWQDLAEKIAQLPLIERDNPVLVYFSNPTTGEEGHIPVIDLLPGDSGTYNPTALFMDDREDSGFPQGSGITGMNI